MKIENFVKNKYKKTILITVFFLLLASLLIGNIVLAQSELVNPLGDVNIGAQDDGLVGCTIDTCTFCDLVGTGQKVIKFMLLQAAPFLAVMMILYGGIRMMVSGGNPEEYGKAKKILIAAFVGVLIVLGAWLVINTIMVGLASGDFAKNWWQIKC